MPLGLLGFLTILVILFLILSKKASTLTCLIAVPILACIIAGHADKIGTYSVDGMKSVVATGVMFIFAVLFFTTMSDAGAFDPIVKGILKIAKNDPVKICVGTVVLTCVTHLDGSGATTFLITIPALLPLYKKLGMRPWILTTLCALAAGTMNMLPWGGPTIRAVSALHSSLDQVFTPMLVPMLCGLLSVFAISVYLGKKERKRLASGTPAGDVSLEEAQAAKALSGNAGDLARPKLFVFNIILILVTVAVMVSSLLPPAPTFMIALVIAMVVNYPDIKLQGKIINSHAEAALMMASVLFAAGSFIGIMGGSGMLDAMATSLVHIIPQSLGSKIPLIIGLIAMPASLLFDPDSYYFGVMPVLASAVQKIGLNPALVARASIAGQMTIGFPLSPLTPSTFLLIGLGEIDLGEHQKKTFPWAYAVSLVILLVAVITGAITL
ncbi:citrate transporter [Caproiciproducens sp. NJN-50]|uniref:CitMHS family transporter n=1 Tax=Acutalibacteraceae TaxID=3082771 RepID=UPI000FFE0BB5|nr:MULTISPECIES: citrate:proton symporter [Acutalibacteraceae]QAT48703.1 citrate transporter [Caproiciproducens sp. NJN-50]